jgi:hypothetical protein
MSEPAPSLESRTQLVRIPTGDGIPPGKTSGECWIESAESATAVVQRQRFYLLVQIDLGKSASSLSLSTFFFPAEGPNPRFRKTSQQPPA